MLSKTTLLDRLAWRLGILDPARGLRVDGPMLLAVVGFHLLALLACWPWLFSWSGLAWALCGLYLFGTLGINIGYHRLLTHQGFACPPWLEKTLAVLGVCCWQGTPLGWVCTHRMHHQHSDGDDDPHSPKKSFFWSHMGWFLVRDPAIWNVSTYDRYGRDLLRVRFYKKLERPMNRRVIQLCQWAFFLLAGFAAGWLASGRLEGGVQLGLSWIVWGLVLRTVLVWHITWSTNSFLHRWGYRNFDTRDNSRNHLFFGLISNGEGWHNNHHGEPRCAAHGRRWWELDVSYLTIRLFEMTGLAWNVVKPEPLGKPQPPAAQTTDEMPVAA